MKDINAESLALHKKNGGKLETVSKVSLETSHDLSLAYSPGVAAVSSLIHADKELAKEYTLKKNTIAVVSDGSSVLGLGNIGPYGAIPVMEGKAAIFKEFAGVDAFPICLDTQDPEEIIKTIKQIAPVFGGINLEDIAAPKCFEIEERLQKELDIPVLHDDQWGAATVTLAALISALKLRGTDPKDAKVVLNGLGAAGVATARLLVAYGVTDIVFCDSKGVVFSGRTDLNEQKMELLKQSTAKGIEGGLKEAVLGADVFIGLSKGGVLSEDMVGSMNKNPIIFALANPEPEIYPGLAYNAGALVVGTGRSDFPNQINNALVFPGLFKAMLRYGIPQFKREMFLGVAEALANMIEVPTKDYILPSIFDKNVIEVIDKVIGKYKL